MKVGKLQNNLDAYQPHTMLDIFSYFSTCLLWMMGALPERYCIVATPTNGRGCVTMPVQPPGVGQTRGQAYL